jgi:glycerate-2-kinase
MTGRGKDGPVVKRPAVTATDATLREDARGIWSAAIAAVAPEQLVARRLAVRGPERELCFDGVPLVPPVRLGGGRVVVVGGGKAAAGMAAGVATLVAPAAPSGVLSVPEGGGRLLPPMRVRETRPATVNLPTPAAVAATAEMLEIVSTLGPDDLAIAVVTGGGSALLVGPRPGVPLEEKIAVAGFLSRAGADIRELNTVRQAASTVKAGGLARACRAGRLLVLVLSDVIGDPLDVIASGPCMPVSVRPREALAILERHGAVAAGVCPRLVAALAADGIGAAAHAATPRDGGSWTTPAGCAVTHLLVGTNATAVAAAAQEARRRGYRLEAASALRDEPADATRTAEDVGRRLAATGLAAATSVAGDGGPRASISGGEATVVVPADHGVGGRNQQTVLAAIDSFLQSGSAWPPGLLLASVGTDGEDGPTDAAGGFADAGVVATIGERNLSVPRALARCDAYPLLDAAGGLVRTGPTGTNVADVRIVLARG